jgi:hypothetical protein
MNAAMQKALDFHAAKAAAYLATAESVPEDRWSAAPAEGKWSPAEVTAHLAQTYEVVTGELRGGKGLAIKTKLWQQILFKLMFGWRIVYFGKFPKGIRAPKEIRAVTGLPKDESIADFRHRSEGFAAAARSAAPGQTMSHTWLGRSGAADGVRFCAQHIEHHRKQIER